jgi:hypothetical protein
MSRLTPNRTDLISQQIVSDAAFETPQRNDGNDSGMVSDYNALNTRANMPYAAIPIPANMTAVEVHTISLNR